MLLKTVIQICYEMANEVPTHFAFNCYTTPQRSNLCAGLTKEVPQRSPRCLMSAQGPRKRSPTGPPEV
eukprot:13628637-Heterocapsa_arctica.AAC.1